MSSDTVATPPEEEMHRLWATRNYAGLMPTGLLKPQISPIEVIKTGTLNHSAGPDFAGATIRLGKLIMYGAVEMHLTASDWYRHGHHKDPAYDNVILHVVLEADVEVRHRLTERPIPTCCMLRSPNSIATSSVPKESLPCAKRISQLSSRQWQTIGRTLYHKRLEGKLTQLAAISAREGYDPSEVLYQLLARYLGAKVNNEAMQDLARSLPLPIVRKHTDSLATLEALWLGQAQLLPSATEEPYLLDLQDRYTFYRHKYSLTPLPPGSMKLARLRPPAFPHRRLAILAKLYHLHPSLGDELVGEHSTAELVTLLQTPPGDYWQHHYSANGSHQQRPIGGLSTAVCHQLIADVVLPFRTFWAQHSSKEAETKELLVEWMETLPAERHHASRLFATEGLKAQNLLQSQAMLTLHSHYCQALRCLECPIGSHLFGTKD